MKRMMQRHYAFRQKKGWQTLLPFLLVTCAWLILSSSGFGQDQPAPDEIKVYLISENQVLANFSTGENAAKKEGYFLITKIIHQYAAKLDAGDQKQCKVFFKGLEKSNIFKEYQTALGIQADKDQGRFYYSLLRYLQDKSKNELVWENRRITLKRISLEHLASLPSKPESSPERLFYLEIKGGKWIKDSNAPPLTPEDQEKIWASVNKLLPRYGKLDLNNDLLVVVRDKTSVVKLAIVPPSPIESANLPVTTAQPAKIPDKLPSEAASHNRKGNPALFALLGFLVAIAGLWGSTWYFSKGLDFEEKVEPTKPNPHEPGRNIPFDPAQFNRDLQSIDQRLGDIKISLPKEGDLQNTIKRAISGIHETLLKSLDPVIQNRGLSGKLQSLGINLDSMIKDLSQVKSDIPSKVQELKENLSDLHQTTEKLLQRLPDPALHLSEADRDIYLRASQIGSHLLAFSEEVRQHLLPKPGRDADNHEALIWRTIIEEFWRNFNTLRLAQYVTNLNCAISCLKPLTKSPSVDTVEEVQQELDSLISSCLGPGKVLLFRLKLITDRTGIPLDEDTTYRTNKLEEMAGDVEKLIAEQPFNLVPLRLYPLAKYPTFKESCLNPIKVDFSSFLPHKPRPLGEDFVLLDAKEWAFQKQGEWLFGRKADVVIG